MIHPCSTLPTVDAVSETEYCERIAESYPFTELLGRGEVGVAFEVMHDFQPMVVKATPLTQEGIDEVKAQCLLNSLSDKTGIFARAFGWIVCDAMPKAWDMVDYEVEEEGQKYLFIFMEKTQKSWLTPKKLKKKMKMTDAQLKHILYLLIHGLYVARKEIGFSHDDLHSGNLMLQVVPGKSGTRFVPKLIDFGFALIGEDSEPEEQSEDDMFGSAGVEASTDMGQIVHLFDGVFAGFFDSEEYWEARASGRNDYKTLKRLLKMDFFKEEATKENTLKCAVCAHNVARYQWRGMAPEYKFCSEPCAMYWGKGIGQFLKDAYYATNIELDTLNNRAFGPVVQYNDPAGHIQVALMSVAPGKRVPLEVHAHLSQFIRVERGYGELLLDGGKKTYPLRDGFATVIPAGTPHEIVNMGQRSLKLYTLYCKDAADAFEH